MEKDVAQVKMAPTPVADSWDAPIASDQVDLSSSAEPIRRSRFAFANDSSSSLSSSAPVSSFNTVGSASLSNQQAGSGDGKGDEWSERMRMLFPGVNVSVGGGSTLQQQQQQQQQQSLPPRPLSASSGGVNSAAAAAQAAAAAAAAARGGRGGGAQRTGPPGSRSDPSIPNAASYRGGPGQDNRPGLLNPLPPFGGFGAPGGGAGSMSSRPLMDPSIVSAGSSFGGAGPAGGFSASGSMLGMGGDGSQLGPSSGANSWLESTQQRGVRGT